MRLYRDVRVVLVRHFIDLGRISIQISMSAVHLRGTLQRLHGSTIPLTPQTVEAIISELGRIKGIKRVATEFDNWRQADTMSPWTPVAARTEPLKPTVEDIRTFNINPDAPPTG